MTVSALGEKENSLANAEGAKSFSTNGPSRMPARTSPTNAWLLEPFGKIA
jgi:hypothetical protein